MLISCLTRRGKQANSRSSAGRAGPAGAVVRDGRVHYHDQARGFPALVIRGVVKRIMAYWLFKSEPNCYAFADLLAAPDRTTGWDGVRNFQRGTFCATRSRSATACSFTTPAPIRRRSRALPRWSARGIPTRLRSTRRPTTTTPRATRPTRPGTRSRSGRAGDRPAAGASPAPERFPRSKGWSCSARGAAFRSSRSARPSGTPLSRWPGKNASSA